jgi:hypothetical protein
MRPRRKTEELVSIKFLDRRRGAVDAATQEELLNHKRLHCAHIARLKEVSGNPVLTLPTSPAKAAAIYTMWHAAAGICLHKACRVPLSCTHGLRASHGALQ